MTCDHTDDGCFKLCCFSFDKFKKICLENKWLNEKYVVFVHGDLIAIGDKERELIKQIYEKYGNIVMCCGKITNKIEVNLIE